MPQAPELRQLRPHVLRDRHESLRADPANLIAAKELVIFYKFVEAFETANFCREGWDHEPYSAHRARDYALARMELYRATRAVLGVPNEWEADDDDEFRDSHAHAPAPIDVLVRRSLRKAAEEHYGAAVGLYAARLRESGTLQEIRDLLSIHWNHWATHGMDAGSLDRALPLLEGCYKPETERSVVIWDFLYRSIELLIASGATEHPALAERNEYLHELEERGDAKAEAAALATLARLRSKKGAAAAA